MERAPVVLTAGLLVAALLVGACTSQQPEASASLYLPDGFPVPPGAAEVSGGDAVAVRVPDLTVEAVDDFYRQRLPATGWEVVGDWDGVDPQGRPTDGMMIQRGEEEGAIALIDEGSGSVLVQVNLRQPAHRESGS